MAPGSLVAIQCSISRLTQVEAAASGDARTTKKREASRAEAIESHSAGLTARPVSSRNTRSARGLYQGLARRWRHACRAGARRPSAACEYEMKASYGAAVLGRAGLCSRLPTTVPSPLATA